MTGTGPERDAGVEQRGEPDERVDASPAEPAVASPARPVSGRTLGIAVALCALVSVIVLEARYMLSTSQQKGTIASTSAPKRSAPESSATPLASLELEPDLAPPEAPALAAVVDAGSQELFQDGEEPPSNADPRQPKKPKKEERALRGTVRDAAARSCSTSSVDRLSRQIIAQARCIDPKAFVPVPRQPNLETAPNVFLFLEASARDHLVRALRANKKKNMTVNSAFRTVAQQYLLRRWALGRRCGIELASLPGESNHESGLALDIAEGPAWRAALEAEGFRWLGAIDRVHYDFKGAASRASVDVKAFQQLWNLNHPDDLLVANGQFGSPTEERLEKSPARGFPKGPRCEQ